MKNTIFISLILLTTFSNVLAQQENGHRRHDKAIPPSYKTLDPTLTDEKHWFDIYKDQNKTFAGELLSMAGSSPLDRGTLNEILYTIANFLFFLNEDRLASETAAVSDWSNVQTLPRVQKNVLTAYEKLLSTIVEEKKLYDTRTVSDLPDAKKLLDINIVDQAIQQKVNHINLINWTGLQEGLTCVSNGTATCLKAAQPLLASLIMPNVLHRQIKKFEIKNYGYDKKETGVFPLTLVSFLQEMGYRINYQRLKLDRGVSSEYKELIKSEILSGDLNLDVTTDVVLKATEFAVLPYNKPVEQIALTAEEVENRPVLFQTEPGVDATDAINRVLKASLSKEVPILPIVFLDSYNSDSLSDTTYENLPIREYYFNPNGMGHVVTLVGYDVCPKNISETGETCYLVRDSFKDPNYAWVKVSNLLKRAMNFIFLTKTNISYAAK